MNEQPVLARSTMLPILLTSSGLISFSIAIYQFALPLYLYDITKSSTMMANLRALEFVPNVVLAAIIGVVVDKINKKRTHQIAVFAQIAILLALAGIVANFQTAQSSWTICVAAFALMTFGYLNDNIRMVMVKMHIPKDTITLANSRLVSVWTTVGIAAPSVAALLLDVVSYQVLFVMLAATLVVAGLVNTRLPQDSIGPTTRNGIIRSLVDGFEVLLANRTLLHLSFIVFVMNAAQGMIDANLVFALKDVAKASNTAIGMTLSCAGFGAFVGSLIAPDVRAKFGLSRFMRASFVLQAVVYVPALVFCNVWCIGSSIFAAACIGMIQSICVWSFRQESTPPEYIGRVGGLTSSIFKLGMPLGIALSGHSVALFGIQSVFAASIFLNLGILCVFPFTAVAKLKI